MHSIKRLSAVLLTVFFTKLCFVDSEVFLCDNLTQMTIRSFYFWNFNSTSRYRFFLFKNQIEHSCNIEHADNISDNYHLLLHSPEYGYDLELVVRLYHNHSYAFEWLYLRFFGNTFDKNLTELLKFTIEPTKPSSIEYSKRPLSDWFIDQKLGYKCNVVQFWTKTAKNRHYYFEMNDFSFRFTRFSSNNYVECKDRDERLKKPFLYCLAFIAVFLIISTFWCCLVPQKKSSNKKVHEKRIYSKNVSMKINEEEYVAEKTNESMDGSNPDTIEMTETVAQKDPQIVVDDTPAEDADHGDAGDTAIEIKRIQQIKVEKEEPAEDKTSQTDNAERNDGKVFQFSIENLSNFKAHSTHTRTDDFIGYGKFGVDTEQQIQSMDVEDSLNSAAISTLFGLPENVDSLETATSEKDKNRTYDRPKNVLAKPKPEIDLEHEYEDIVNSCFVDDNHETPHGNFAGTMCSMPNQSGLRLRKVHPGWNYDFDSTEKEEGEEKEGVGVRKRQTHGKNDTI